MMLSILGYTLIGDLPGKNTFRKMETTRYHPHQNVLVTQMQVKTLHKQQTSHIYNNTETNLNIQNTTMGYGFHSNIEILECLQLNALQMTVEAPWYMLNMVIRRNLQTPTVKAEIHRYSSQYSACLRAHPSDLVVNLMEQSNRRREDTCRTISLSRNTY
jgi:hypothetical protein